ncbi:TauD/TfdA dioxygenase family protein [Glaciimonas immobilis]|uniref:Taurine dioxygenase n=1 Tax=Glaciimonas immobilis TaxID=728004 RepID=A0A840RU73_9BURK|nr:TauD/TfdA family dioxygenase [Glaciimonas immobilis]KAF3996468.1 TauD/TfdA family dioxygenase [Glaciimonas immobilis]MBB5201183.1 taurine dioxygenase [Glaciimonas immobilis]
MSLNVQTTSQGKLTVRPLGSALGAEVLGIDMRQPLDKETLQQVRDIWSEHLVLVFPQQHITDQEHVEFTRNFGDPEIFHQDIIRSKSVREIFRVSNVDESGVLMPPDHPTSRQVSLAQFWHTDSSYRAIPCTGSLLHGIEVSRSGGETQFTNMYAVYEALPEALKREVQGRKALHDFEFLQKQNSLRPLTDAERAAMPPVWQPLVRIHPVTGRKSLYISPIYNEQVEGMAPGAGRDLIAELTAFSGQPQFVYSHRWETDDVVLWDNRCTMHQVTKFDADERRVMHRTTIVGDAAVVAA